MGGKLYMSNCKYDWCYFNNDTKQKITNWFKVNKDILFVINDELYLFKKDGFEDEELEKLFIANKQNIIRPILRKSRFYKHISPNIFHLPPNFNITNPDEWILVNIEKIELRSSNI